MMMPSFRAAAIGLMVAGAAPLFAQVAAPAAPAAPAAASDAVRAERMAKRAQLRSQVRMQHTGKHWGMYAGMSDAGKATMREAMKAGDDRRADREAVKAARERMLTALEAERLDAGALKRAMDDERKAAQAGHDKRQAAMLAGFTKLSAADRKAFVTNARMMKDRMEKRVIKLRERKVGQPGDMPPPPPPPM